MFILGLEASTSSAKAVIYSYEEGLLGELDKTFSEDVSDVVSQDPEGIFIELMDCAKELLNSKNEDIRSRIAAVALSSTWHSLLLLDKERKPLGRTITWANNMAAGTVEKYRRDEDLVERVYKTTGCPLHTTFPLWKWLHLKEEKSTEGESYLISSQPEYLFMRLTGERGVSLSVASGSGFLNIHNLKWDEDILKLAGLKEDQLGPLYEPDFNLPIRDEFAETLGLKSGIPVILTGPDGALNQIGAGAMGQGIMTMSVGTSGAIRMASLEPVLPQDAATWCYYVAEGKRLAGAATSGAGNCINWFAKTLNRGVYSYRELEDPIDLDMQREGPIFLPFIYGERSPGWRGARLGGFQDLRDHHGLSDMHYSIMEGVLFNIYHCYESLTEAAGLPEEIRLSGGIENSPLWLQMAADIFQKELYTFDLEHSSIMGAVVLGLKAIGLIETTEDFVQNYKAKIVPNKNMKEFYEKRFSRYKEWYYKTI